MTTSIVLTSLVSGLITWLFMYIDSRIFDTPKTKLTYFKGISFVSLLSATIVYFMGSPSLPKQFGGNVNVGPIQPMATNMNQGTALVQGINQEMFTGMPSF